jgi:chromosome segregation ATPase
MKWSTVVLTLALLGLAIGGTIGVAASQAPVRQASAPQEDVLPALLIEVRGLRAAMEQMALARVQLQEQRVNNLLRRVEETRDRLAEKQRGYENSQQEIRGLESMIRDPKPGGPPVSDLQAMQRGHEQELPRQAAEIQRLTAEAATLDADLATEQGRWIDLNQRMEALEQSLVRR